MRNPNKQSIPPPLTVLYLLLVALHIIPVLNGSPALWGVNQWYYFPKSAAYILLAVSLIPVVPFLRNAIIQSVTRIGSLRITERLETHPLIPYVILSGVAALFWSLRNATDLLGDGFLWANNMRLGALFSYKEPLASLLYQGTYNLLCAPRSPVSPTPHAVAAVISVISGLFFLVFAYKTVRIITENAGERFFIFLALLSTGTIAMFFGYIEAYPPLAAGTMAFVYFGIRYIQKRSGAAGIVIVFFLAVLLHFSAIALAPGLAIVLLSKRLGAIKEKKYYMVLSVIIAAGLVILWVARRQGMFSGFFDENFLPFFTSSKQIRVAYPLFSLKHLFDMINEILLICPFAIFAITFLSFKAKESPEFGGGTIRFLETLAIFYFLEFLVFNKVLGASRDWDLFSPMAIPLALLTATTLIGRFRERVKVLAVFTFFIFVLHTGPWIALNSNEDKSVSRFIDLAAGGTWSGYARAYAYDVLGSYYSNRGNLPEALKFSNAASRADPKNVRYRYNSAAIYTKIKQYNEAAHLYEGVIRQDPNHVDARCNLGMIYLQNGDLESAESQFKSILQIDSTFIQAYNNLASMYFQQNRLEETINMYGEFIKLVPDDPVAHEFLGRAYLKTGDYSGAVNSLKRAIELRRGYHKPYLLLGRLYIERGDFERAAVCLGQGVNVAPDNRDMRFALAGVLDSLDRGSEALAHLLYILESRKDDIEIITRAGEIYLKHGQFENALKMFETAAQIVPEHSFARLGLARTFYELKDYERSWDEVLAAENSGAEAPAVFIEKLTKKMKRPFRKK